MKTDRLHELEEQICLMVGWTPVGNSPREKALYELWAEWKREYEKSGGSLRPWDHPELSDERINELAERRDAKRAETLAKMTERSLA